jgi:hypothetical protein
MGMHNADTCTIQVLQRKQTSEGFCSLCFFLSPCAQGAVLSVCRLSSLVVFVFLRAEIDSTHRTINNFNRSPRGEPFSVRGVCHLSTMIQ